MLTSLTISNFTLVSHLDIEFSAGMTAVTGETGAGKSLILDALGLALGDRGDTDRIREGQVKAEVSALFILDTNLPALAWLDKHGFACADFPEGQANDNIDCLMRRTFTREGRSRGFINGQSATMAQLRELGAFIIDIHNQHEHQSLLGRDQQRALLDDFGGHHKLCNSVAAAYESWLAAKTSFDQWQQRSESSAAQRELLSFQLDELSQLGLAEGEIEALEREQVLLANAGSILTDSQLVLGLCDDNDGNDNQVGANGILNKACTILENMPERTRPLEEALNLLNSARIQVGEAGAEIQHQLSSSELDPGKLAQVEERLTQSYQLARKHKVNANELPTLLTRLADQLEELGGAEANVEALAAHVDELEASYVSAAKKLSKSRVKAGANFTVAVNNQLSNLAMAGASIKIVLPPNKDNRYSARGLEGIELLISTNPGQAHQALNKVASGGELSRVSLAIQVVAAEHSSVPVLVFDEVDVGVGGATASVIGKLLSKLGEKGQVICISHQAQVASYAQHHLLATKAQIENASESHLVKLSAAARKEEIARMLGGEKITEKTRLHAEEMLAAGSTT